MLSLNDLYIKLLGLVDEVLSTVCHLCAVCVCLWWVYVCKCLYACILYNCVQVGMSKVCVCVLCRYHGYAARLNINMNSFL